MLTQYGAVPRPGSGIVEPAASRTEPGPVRWHLVPHLERHVAGVLPHAQHDADPVVGLALEGGHQLLAVDRHVRVRVDDGWNHRFSPQIYAGGAGRHLYLAGPADLGEFASLDDKGGVLDRRARGADDHAGAFVDGCASGGWRLRADERRDQDERQGEEERDSQSAHDGLREDDAVVSEMLRRFYAFWGSAALDWDGAAGVFRLRL